MTTALQLLHHWLGAAGAVLIVACLCSGITLAMASAGEVVMQRSRKKRLPAPTPQPTPEPRPYNEPTWQTRDLEIQILQDVMQYAVAGKGTRFYLLRCYSCEAMLLLAQWPASSTSYYEPNGGHAAQAGWTYHDIPGIGCKYLCPNHTRAVRELLAPNA